MTDFEKEIISMYEWLDRRACISGYSAGKSLGLVIMLIYILI